jgi:hypothetical protein
MRSSTYPPRVADDVFVVMQIGEKGSPERKRADEVFDFVIKPVLEARGLAPYRADLDPTPGNITPQLLKKLLEAKAVIADLTGRNPNVFYELGIAHSFQKPLVALAASAKDLPFDTSDERVIELGAHVGETLGMAQGERAKVALNAALDVILAEGYEPRSPVTAVATGRRIDDLTPEDPIASDLAAIRDLVEELRDRPAPSSVDIEDVLSLRNLVLDLAHSGQVSVEQLQSMVTQTTSTGFDSWVGALIAKRHAPPAVEDPWSSRPATNSGGWSDEPPF